MAQRDRGPDANAAPLTSQEQAVFDELVSQVDFGDRSKARFRAVSVKNPLPLALLSMFASSVLLVAVAVIAPLSVWVAAGCWLALVVVVNRSLPRWKALLSGVWDRIWLIISGP